MAKFSVSGLQDLMLDLEQIAQLPDTVLDQMLVEAAEIVERKQKEVGKEYGVHRTGMTLASIKRGSPKRGKDGKTIYIYPQGMNADGNRNAEVAFVNEFGKRGQPARPFIRDANEQAADEIAAAMEKEYDDWLESR